MQGHVSYNFLAIDLSTFYSYFYIFDIFWHSLDLTLITLGGLLVNFKSRKWQLAYQIFVFCLLMSARYNALPEFVKEFMPLAVGDSKTGVLV